jgi:hypothetical protein
MDCDGDNRENEVLLVAEQKSPLPPDFSTAVCHLQSVFLYFFFK